VIIMDTEERIRAFLPELDELAGNGTVLIDEAGVCRYRGMPTA
jgi:hypothetical protein